MSDVSDELRQVAAALGESVVGARVLAGGFSHETSLLTLAGGGRVVVRLGGSDHGVEAAVMAAARRHVPVPDVLKVLPVGSAEGSARSAMVLEYVARTPLSEVLAGETDATELKRLGAVVGEVAVCVSAVTFERPGFFADSGLGVAPGPPWSQQLPEFAAHCMSVAPEERLDAATRRVGTALLDPCPGSGGQGRRPGLPGALRSESEEHSGDACSRGMAGRRAVGLGVQSSPVLRMLMRPI